VKWRKKLDGRGIFPHGAGQGVNKSEVPGQGQLMLTKLKSKLQVLVGRRPQGAGGRFRPAAEARAGQEDPNVARAQESESCAKKRAHTAIAEAAASGRTDKKGGANRRIRGVVPTGSVNVYTQKMKWLAWLRESLAREELLQVLAGPLFGGRFVDFPPRCSCPEI
jgi:hypothetical protein